MLIRPQDSVTENNDEASEMVLTNEVTLPVNHTESTDVNEIYMKEISNLTASIESTSQSDQTTNQVTQDATESKSELSLPNIISVICIWC